MEPLPHHYNVTASATTDSNVALKGDNLPEIISAPPAEFGGPGDQWSPESLLVAAVADCFILSFRAIARASKLDWLDLHCEVSGTLERVERTTRFTAISVDAKLTISADTNADKAEKLLHKAEDSCLITNSLIADSTLSTHISVVA
ncbi:MAG: peroxiredoxin-like protein [Halieaceae bacterium]|jgi:peroxiredoxin-like protein